ncbi:DUF3795 domain-containing protein [candidate division KSB1 bacterium]|nr:DUF3795 domain-containing protein [candidate division KSB1 bacterium]
MEPIIARCGNRCDTCPIYEGNINGADDQKRVSEKFEQYFGFAMPPESMICAGCFNTDGPQVTADCAIRNCAVERQLDNCAHCNDFACEKLQPSFGFIEKYVKDLAGIPEDDYRIYIEPFLCKDNLMKIRSKIEG